MRIVAILIFSLIPLSGCIALHAHLPEDVVRTMAREDGAELAAICSHDGRSFSEGAIACMDAQRMTCSAAGRWVPQGSCVRDGLPGPGPTAL